MDVGFARRRGYSYGYVLQCAAETGHRMTLEVGEHHKEVVVQEILAHNIRLQMPPAAHGKLRLAVSIHDVHTGYASETVLPGHLHVAVNRAALAAVGRVALNYRAFHHVYKILYQGRLQVVWIAGLPS